MKKVAPKFRGFGQNKIYHHWLCFKHQVSAFPDLGSQWKTKVDEMFTFEPAPFLGGDISLETVKKVNLHIQLSILADFSEREIVDLDTMGGMAFG